jgi:gas vesicle protein
MPDKPEGMPDKSTLIMEHMDETRKDLADKLEQLEKKVTGTVESVTDLVEKVPETVDTVKETIQETVSTVSGTVHNTVEAVKDTVADTVESVKSFFDIPRQVDRHPWLMMGGSVLLGYLGGRLLLPRRSAEEEHRLAPSTPEFAFTPSFEPSYPSSPPAARTYESARAPEESRETEAEPPRENWVSRLSQRFGGEINKVKELAVGTLLGVARDMITRWAPENLRQDVTELVNNFTRDLGGKVIEGPVLGQGEQAPQGAEEPQEGGHGSSERHEAQEPVATRKGGRSQH